MDGDFRKLLDEHGRIIPYCPALVEECGGVIPAIFLAQVAYWFERNDYEPFWKFKAPSTSDFYRDGDSWTEELGFSRRQFDRAREAVSARVRKGDSRADLFADNFVIYWLDGHRRTWYELNLSLLREALSSRES